MLDLPLSFLKILFQIPKILDLWERVKTWWQQRNAVEDLTTPESVAKRFIQLFEAHGVLKTQIPKFFGHDLKIADFQTEEKLLEKLTDELLQDACDLFCIRRQWLDGEDEQIYPLHDFDSEIENYKKFLLSIKSRQDLEQNLSIVCIRTENVLDYDANTLIIIEEKIRDLNDKGIFRYHLCNNWVYGYWCSRAYIAACAAISMFYKNHFFGRFESKNWLDQFQFGCNFLIRGYDSSLPISGHCWEPEDLILDPIFFLEGFDRNSYEYHSALELWLKLCDDGYMLSYEKLDQSAIRAKFAKYYDQTLHKKFDKFSNIALNKHGFRSDAQS